MVFLLRSGSSRYLRCCSLLVVPRNAGGYGHDGVSLSMFGGLIYDKSCSCCRIMFSIVANFVISKWLSSWFIVTNYECRVFLFQLSLPTNSPGMIILTPSEWSVIFEWHPSFLCIPFRIPFANMPSRYNFYQHRLRHQFLLRQFLVQLIFIIRLRSLIISQNLKNPLHTSSTIHFSCTKFYQINSSLKKAEQTHTDLLIDIQYLFLVGLSLHIKNIQFFLNISALGSVENWFCNFSFAQLLKKPHSISFFHLLEAVFRIFFMRSKWGRKLWSQRLCYFH